MTTRHERYELYYWPEIEGRGEFVRLVFEEAGVPYVDVARLPESEGGGIKAMMRLLRGEEASGFRPLAPPFIKVGHHVIAQTANIVQWLAPRFGLVPDDEESRLEAHAIQLTLADLVSEVHDTHHPISSGLYYEDQKVEAKRRASAFVAERMPKYLGWLEDLLRRNKASGGRHLVGAAISYVDLSAFQVVNGLGHAFPNGLARIERDLPLLLALKDRIASRPRVAAYLASDRRKPFDLNGLFRRYPELDA